MYICIEGVIGAGKTSLVNLLNERYKATTLLEVVDENPFLKDFYSNQEISFQTEMFFLVNRYTQLKNIDYNNNNLLISDYTLYKSMIFAKETLKETEYSIFKNFFHNINNNIPQPDLLIFLSADLSVLKYRIKLRNRKFEQNIPDDYLINLQNEYINYINFLKKNNVNVLVIDVNNIDFVNNDADKNYIINKINEKIKIIKKENDAKL